MTNDLQNAYQLSQMTYNYAAVQVPAGMFAVVTESAAYCPITDAVLPGMNRHLIRLCGSRRVAEYYASKAAASHGYEDGDSWVAVLPKVQPNYAPAKSSMDDDIPF